MKGNKQKRITGGTGYEYTALSAGIDIGSGTVKFLLSDGKPYIRSVSA